MPVHTSLPFGIQAQSAPQPLDNLGILFYNIRGIFSSPTQYPCTTHFAGRRHYHALSLPSLQLPGIIITRYHSHRSHRSRCSVIERNHTLCQYRLLHALYIPIPTHARASFRPLPSQLHLLPRPTPKLPTHQPYPASTQKTKIAANTAMPHACSLTLMPHQRYRAAKTAIPLAPSLIPCAVVDDEITRQNQP